MWWSFRALLANHRHLTCTYGAPKQRESNGLCACSIKIVHQSLGMERRTEIAKCPFTRMDIPKPASQSPSCTNP
ncbi:hypothetical protein SCLCIDRAFT_924844 [Scleroderma citrinum Foug A]|uniref:Uncharacterized protein n=1 Tax=Scleroderma citrinum Foug A TaxID=1036808 RepID=A0A0C3DJN2_9AGAM|nr:hypothetical protein SCLCIDRAFT_924844 [Scleroderma citrinum Foug A]